MGCDIHMFTEHFVDGAWRFVAVGPYEGRNYELFAVLADVRNGYEIEPISKPRGIPKNASPEYRKKCQEWSGDGHSHSYFTLAQLKAFDWERGENLLGVIPVFEEPGRFGSTPYQGLRGTGKAPESYSGGIGGPGLVTVSMEEADALLDETTPRDPAKSYYVRYEWRESLREAVGFDKTMAKLAEIDERTDRVRICFFFAN